MSTNLVTCDWHGNDPHGEIAACRNPRPVPAVEVLASIAREHGFEHQADTAQALYKATCDAGEPSSAAVIDYIEGLAAVREVQARYIELRQQYEAVQKERRDVMKLAHDSGASYQDLADILGVNRQTVAKMLRPT